MALFFAALFSLDNAFPGDEILERSQGLAHESSGEFGNLRELLCQISNVAALPEAPSRIFSSAARIPSGLS
jgi:hypothetical protein